jgi:hypothetical protein
MTEPEPEGLRPGLPSFARWRGLKEEPGLSKVTA